MSAIWFGLSLLQGVACDKGGPAEDALTLSAESLDFGTVGVYASATLEVELSKTGETSVEILSASLISGDSGVWDVDRSDESVLEDGDSLVLSITFAPQEETDYSGSIQIRTTDEEASSLYIELTGIGGPSELDQDKDGYSPATGDCDDGNASVYPGAEEICDGLDNDCDDLVPSEESDDDYDGWRICDEDCDDSDPNVYPGAEEICDDKDTDCDGENLDRADVDGDGYSLCDGDCEDEAPEAHPGAEEVCDGLDNDCTGEIDDLDGDGDGFSICAPLADCDDEDANAHPVALSLEGSDDEGFGTPESPYQSLDRALEDLDETCRTIYMLPGEYDWSLSWSSDEPFTLQGGGVEAEEVVIQPPEGRRALEIANEAELSLKHLTLSGASASGDGGAAFVDGGILRLEDVTLSENHSTGDGGAISVTSGALYLLDCSFLNNVADDDGGAVSSVASLIRDQGSLYSGNRGVRGGAIVAEASEIDLLEISCDSNYAADEGGGLAIVGSSSVSVQRGSFTRNEAENRGGGIAVVDANAPTGFIQNSWILQNTASSTGGGVSFSGTTAAMTFSNNTLLSNSSGGEGAGVWVGADTGTELLIWSNIIGWSDGDSGLYSAEGIGVDAGWNLAYATYSGVDYAGEIEENESNLVANPLFADFSDDGLLGNDDLQLAEGSPAIDSGPDLPGWGDPDGSQNDRGATGGPGAE